MCHWKKWIWPGLLTVGLLTLLTLWWKSDFIEKDLQAKATSALTAQGYQWTQVEMDGRDATIRGAAPNEESQQTAALLTDQAYDVRVVSNKAGLIAAQSPYVVSAKRDGDAIELNGFVPDEATRAKILAATAAAIPSAKITDKMTLARGAPEGFTEIADFGLKQLSNLNSGEMSISDTELSIKGAAPDQDKFGLINSALAGALPAGALLALKEITAPVASPYVWSANYNGSTVELVGHVPSDTVRQAIIAKAGTILPGMAITDNQIIASGEPANFEVATGFALEQLPRFSNGMVELSDKNLSIAGVSKDSDAYNAAKAAALGSLPAGLVLASEKIVPSTVKPYTWNADYDGAKVTLGGYVPDDATRTAIVADTGAKLPDATIEDQMQTAAGAPETFQAGTSFALGQLPNFSSGSVSLSDLKLTVSGISKDASAYSAARDAVSGSLPAQLALASEDIKPATISPYTWRADFAGSTTKLSGYVPGNDARNGLIRGVKELLGGTVVDEMQIADGEPEGFDAATRFALEQLPRFSEGFVALSDLNLTVEGISKDSATYRAAKAAVGGALPAALSLAGERIAPPTVSPYQWSADYNGKVVTLDGFVPDEASRAKILSDVKAKLPKARINDNMQIGAGAPKDFSGATNQAIGLLPRFNKGNVGLVDTDLTVKGDALTDADFSAAQTTVKGNLTGGLSLAMADIKPAPAPKDYTWEAERKGSAIVLSGFAPSKAERSAFADSAREAFPGTTVVNRIVPREDAPGGFVVNANKGMNLLTRLSTGKVSIVNQMMSIEGQASSVDDYETAQADIAGDLSDGYKWNVRDIKPALMSPYTWSLVKGGDKAEQSGFVPSRGFGNSMVAATTATLVKPVTDTQRIAVGEPENFGDAVAAAISGVSALEDSRASISDTDMQVEGRAQSEADANRIRSEIAASVPANFKVKSEITYPEPKPEPKRVVKVEPKPEPEPKPVVKVEPKPEPKPEPEPVLKAEPKPEPKPAPKPVVKVEPKPKPASKKVAKIEPKPAPPPKIACEVRIRRMVANEKIQFATDRALIRSGSNVLLNRIANEAKTCPNAKFEVWGHTDARGRQQYNQQLSEARARSVVSFLANAGVKRENLKPVGYGELRPLQTNETISGRAANRRIEFVVVSN